MSDPQILKWLTNRLHTHVFFMWFAFRFLEECSLFCAKIISISTLHSSSVNSGRPFGVFGHSSEVSLVKMVVKKKLKKKTKHFNAYLCVLVPFFGRTTGVIRAALFSFGGTTCFLIGTGGTSGRRNWTLFFLGAHASLSTSAMDVAWIGHDLLEKTKKKFQST